MAATGRLSAVIERILRRFPTEDEKPFVSSIHYAGGNVVDDGAYGDPHADTRPGFVRADDAGWERASDEGWVYR